MTDLVSDTVLLAVLRALAAGTPARADALAASLGTNTAAVEAALHTLLDYGLLGPGSTTGPAVVPAFAPFIVLDERALRDRLGVHGQHGIWHVRVAAALDSTNSALLREARSHSLPPLPALLAAEIQYAGRGRQGRTWAATAGQSLTASFVWQFECGVGALSGLSLACGLAAREAIAGCGVAVQLKWPNDVLAEGRKLAGILVEVHPLDHGSTIAVIGIGINVSGNIAATSMNSGSLAPTSLQACGAPVPFDRNVLLADLAGALARVLRQFERAGFGSMAAQWNAADAFRGEQIRLLEGGSETLAGTACGVDDKGYLRVSTSGGMRSIMAGDVSLRAGR